MAATPVPVPSDYSEVLDRLKREILSARTRATLAINAELVTLYWRIGNEILDRQADEGWGTKVIDRLAADLSAAFDGMKGLSPRNLKYMRALAAAWPDPEDVQRLVAQLPWGHNLDLLDKLDDDAQRRFYATKAIQNDWTRKVLQAQIASRLHQREGKALTNFDTRLPESEVAAAQLITRDPYTFDFVALDADAKERDLERALVADLREFMLELGAGFSFVGSQVHLEVDNEDFYIDLLFFHIPTNRYVVIDLKLEKFKPKDAGQINFYVNVVDDQLRLDHHASTIGLVLCATRSEQIVRYALDGIDRPVGVAAWEAPPHNKAVLADVTAEVAELPVKEIEEGFQRIVGSHADELAETGDEAEIDDGTDTASA